ncbi:type II 3-dehydroquinate dehydratase, partial [Xanthovirga aplysinae]|uniref:type II 3-dehydroquinate dehydratase n=1 Tax=Xanthovirga aplysinae TaxID=2529853 RepID=UPI0012BBE30C
GPNLNLLGVREKSIYGTNTFEDYYETLCTEFPDITMDYFQSNIEGEIVDKLHEIGFNYDGIILNAGAYTHTSVAITDAIAGIKTPVFEVHISNIYCREDFRHKSLLSRNCVGIISGVGLEGYKLALLHYIFESKKKKK